MKNIFITFIFIIITLVIIVSKSDWCHHMDKLRAKSTKPVESFKCGFVEETFIIILPHHWIIISSDRHIVNSPCRYFLFTNMFLWIFQKARQSKWQGHSKYENKCHLLWQSLFKSYFQLQQNDHWMAHFKEGHIFTIITADVNFTPRYVNLVFFWMSELFRLCCF